jgi:hypothetical protein
MLFSSDDQGEVRVWDLVTKAPAFKNMAKVCGLLLWCVVVVRVEGKGAAIVLAVIRVKGKGRGCMRLCSQCVVPQQE